MTRTAKIAIGGMLALVAAGAVVAGALLPGEDVREAASAPGCARDERVSDRDPMEPGVNRGERVLLACVRLRGGKRAQVIGYRLNGRPCIDAVDPKTGEGGGCNDEIGESSIEVGGRLLRAGRGERISGRTDPRVVKVRARSLSREGCIVHARAGYVRVRDPSALERTSNRRPFGFYVVELPRGASPLTLEAVARQNRVLGRARLGPEGLRGAAPATASATCERPFMGVSCRKPGSIACDRVAVYVSASLFAESVRVTIAGRRLRLPRRRGVGPDGRSTFEGFLQPAGLRDGPLRGRTEPGTDRWVGDPPVSVPVRVDVRLRGGRRASRRFHLRLAPGYG